MDKKKVGETMIIDFLNKNPEFIKYILIYLIIINLTGFIAMAIDKRRAKKGEWRIKEYTLLMITLLGGGIGTIAGMYTFRHKTKKLKFVIGFPMILILEVFLVIYLLLKV